MSWLADTLKSLLDTDLETFERLLSVLPENLSLPLPEGAEDIYALLERLAAGDLPDPARADDVLATVGVDPQGRERLLALYATVRNRIGRAQLDRFLRPVADQCGSALEPLRWQVRERLDVDLPGTDYISAALGGGGQRRGGHGPLPAPARQLRCRAGGPQGRGGALRR
jgi:hypothetical protein